MAVPVIIDFKNIYEITNLTNDLREYEFETELQKGGSLPLKISISNEPHELIPMVYNFAFRPFE